MQLTLCDRCHFDAGDYRRHDLATAGLWLWAMADQYVEGVPSGVLAREPQSATHAELRRLVSSLQVDAPDAEIVHRAIHHLHDVGRQLHAGGGGVPSQRGTVAQLSASDGGVPKVPIDSVDVGLRGVLGDRQANRKHHGRPFQALCLWSAEVIEALQAEGHPVHPGSTGENVTVAGIDWAELRPGARVLVGEVLCEISVWALPCRKIDRCFTGRSDRIDHATNPGWSRAYAWVLEPGAITTGDEVVVEP
ncbi:MAG TPA: MOSC domain-containing protein [Acidimicrobiales bacterium]|nr:MOSC domain-containing protein [Acidimicrobiales bacterium]